MEFKKLSSNSRALLSEIVEAKNPTSFLCKKLEKAAGKGDELRCILHDLTEKGFLKIKWADNKPYNVVVNNSARTYEQQLEEYEQNFAHERNASISIGNNNKIHNSVIAGSITDAEIKRKKGFFEKHPVICGFLISLAAGIVLLFSFWNQIIHAIERLF